LEQDLDDLLAGKEINIIIEEDESKRNEISQD
jgi:hypothetical protein